MDKPSDSSKGDASVKGVMRRRFVGLNEVPKELCMVALDEQPKENVLLVPKEDMEAFKEQYKVLGSSSIAARARVHFRNLGFDDGCLTFMRIRDKKVKFPGKSLYALGRSWFKEGFIKKDKAVDVECIISFPEGDKEKNKRNDDDKDGLDAKKLLREFVMQAKARARIAKMKGKKVQKQRPFAPTRAQKKVRFALTPDPAPTHRGNGKRKRRAPKMRSMKDIMANTERMPDA